jgi:hypothetical protein
MALNRALKLAIVGSGQKQKDIARRARINQWRLSRIVTQDVVPQPAEMQRLATVLRTPVSTLFTSAGA